MSVEFVLSGTIFMKKFGCASIFSGSVIDSYVPDLVECIGCVRDQLAKEDFFVRVKCVDDQTHKLLDISIECESLCHRCLLNIRSWEHRLA